MYLQRDTPHNSKQVVALLPRITVGEKLHFYLLQKQKYDRCSQFIRVYVRVHTCTCVSDKLSEV